METQQLTAEQYDKIARQQITRDRKDKRRKILNILFIIFIFPILPLALLFLHKANLGWYDSEGSYQSLNDQIIIGLYFLIVVLSFVVYESRKKIKKLKFLLSLTDIKYRVEN